MIRINRHIKYKNIICNIIIVTQYIVLCIYLLQECTLNYSYVHVEVKIGL